MINLDLDQILSERRYYSEDDIGEMIKHFLNFRDWDALTRFVLFWGISFRVCYGKGRNGEPLPWSQEIIILRCHEHPYYDYIEPKVRKEFKEMIKLERKGGKWASAKTESEPPPG